MRGVTGVLRIIFSCSKSLFSMSVCVINQPKTWQLETPPVKSFSWFPASVQLRFGQAAAPQRTPSHLVLDASYPPGPAISQGTRETPSQVLSVAPRGEERREEERLQALDAPPRAHTATPTHGLGQSKSQASPQGLTSSGGATWPLQGAFCGPGRTCGHWAAYHSPFYNDLMGPLPLGQKPREYHSSISRFLRAELRQLFFANLVCLLAFYLHAHTERR